MHRAPNGTLRLYIHPEVTSQMVCQKAPSAKRCIKTASAATHGVAFLESQKAPSAKRCIKTETFMPSSSVSRA